jgi:OmpA-OmpF porin, OOP family
MQLLRALVLGAGLTLTSAAAGQAQMFNNGPDGPYISGDFGWNHLNDFTGRGTGTNLNFTATPDEGFILGGAAGWKWGLVRLQLDIQYRNNGVNGVQMGTTGNFPAALAGARTGGGGTVESEAFMADGLVDIPWSFLGLVPYVGAGVGGVNIDHSNITVAGTTIANSSFIAPALQVMGGLRYQLTNKWELGLEYRYLTAFNPRFNDTTGGRYDTTFNNHSLMLQVTYHFGAPTPPPAPMVPAAAPAPPPPMAGQEFIVFFDFNKATLTPAGRQVVVAAAAAFKAGGSPRIDASGYTDRAGTAQYNMGLSERRADTVRDALVAQGVPATAIATAWHGEENPRVPTPDGVREPQNRRVEIMLH